MTCKLSSITAAAVSSQVDSIVRIRTTAACLYEYRSSELIDCKSAIRQQQPLVSQMIKSIVVPDTKSDLLFVIWKELVVGTLAVHVMKAKTEGATSVTTP